MRLFSNIDLKKLIIPLVLEQLLIITVGMADTMMVSSAGEAAISAVSLVDIINVMITGILSAIATGGAVVISQLIGEKNIKDANEASKQLLYTCFLIGLLLFAIVLIFKNGIINLFYYGVESNVMNQAITYLLILGFAYPFIAIYQAIAAILRSMRCSNITFKVSILINIINVVGNAIGVLWLKLGVVGVAIPSLVSYMIGSIIMYKILKNKKRMIYFKNEPIQLNKKMIRKILNISIPNGIENGLFYLGRVLVVSIISQFATYQIAANGVANNLDTLGLLLGFAFNQATITVVGQCVGANDEQQVRYYIKKLIKLLYISAAILNILILVFIDPILDIYQVSVQTKALAKILVWLHNGSAILIWPIAFTLPNALRACNDVKYTMYVSIFSMFAFRIGLGYILGSILHLGAIGVWIGLVCDWIFRTILYGIRYLNNKWRSYANFV